MDGWVLTGCRMHHPCKSAKRTKLFERFQWLVGCLGHKLNSYCLIDTREDVNKTRQILFGSFSSWSFSVSFSVCFKDSSVMDLFWIDIPKWQTRQCIFGRMESHYLCYTTEGHKSIIWIRTVCHFWQISVLKQTFIYYLENDTILKLR